MRNGTLTRITIKNDMTIFYHLKAALSHLELALCEFFGKKLTPEQSAYFHIIKYMADRLHHALDLHKRS